jgi:hypothetical protein
VRPEGLGKFKEEILTKFESQNIKGVKNDGILGLDKTYY